jgi:hypothetical protein
MNIQQHSEACGRAGFGDSEYKSKILKGSLSRRITKPRERLVLGTRHPQKGDFDFQTSPVGER